MQEAQDRIKEGNRAIGEFMDISNFKIDPDSGRFLVCRNCPIVGWYDLGELQYRKDWRWQIPVYSKLAKAMKDLIVISPGELDDEIHDRFKRFTERYEKAIYNNNLEAGFDEIVFNLERYNEFKQKR